MVRPAPLFPLFADVTSLKGVGDVSGKALQRLLPRPSPLAAEATSSTALLRDLLFHLPTGLIDRRQIYPLATAPLQQVVTLKVKVTGHHPPPRSKRRLPYRVTCEDETCSLVLTFFNAREDYLKKQLPDGQWRIISGALELYDGTRQMSHPDLIAAPEKLEQVARLEPVYPLTYALTQKQLRYFMSQAMSKLPVLPEWLEPTLLQSRGWKPFHESLTQLHNPEDAADIAEQSPHRLRLAYDEMLANQLALAMIRRHSTKQKGTPVALPSALQGRLEAMLPFALTTGQQQVLADIMNDMASGNRMLRLLQGDVGSGKTVVSVMAMLPIIESGAQAALMVPTDILGRQHVATIGRLVSPLGLRVAHLSGKLSAKEKQAVYGGLADGSIHIVVGTHALFQEAVHFHRLGLVVIDEQHRFGVAQRLALSDKGVAPHVLLMTATPIPRSLTMTAYGDMESSQLTEKPANRPAIDTRAMPLDRIDEVVAGLKRAIGTGARIYWICPLVEEAEPEIAKDFEGDLAAAVERYEVFRQVFGERVALAHGKMKAPERNAAMQAFATGAADILVATTVVEVGVDVPEATIIVIEHAERFGLAQLHQLRGRVGRSDKPSSCILLYHSRCSEVAKKRLSIIRESNDGFYIAEEDLMLRGAGDVLGTRQSGLPAFRFADLAAHRELVLMARDDVKLLLYRDPDLQSERGQALRQLLYLFDYDSSLRWLKAG